MDTNTKLSNAIKTAAILILIGIFSSFVFYYFNNQYHFSDRVILFGVLGAVIFSVLAVISYFKKSKENTILASRMFLGILFTFSGFVKAIDPLGSTYKFHDYFTAFGMPAFGPYAFALAIFLSGVEFLVGISLLFNLKPKLASWGAICFMLIFTPVTLYLAIANPVHDCGCFGDALIITNWQTFYKNIVIDIFILVLVLNYKSLTSNLKNLHALTGIIGVAIFITVFQFFCMKYYFPAFDFRPYKLNTNIPEKMKIPENAPQDEYQTKLYYQNLKTGKTEEFGMDNYPWQDTLTWKWVDTKSILVKEGYKPPIKDFTITLDSTDLTEKLINSPEPVLLIIAYDLNHTNIEGLKNLKSVFEDFKNNNNSIYCLTSSPQENVKEVKKKLDFELEFCKTDEVTLKTVIRSNPGILLIKNGTIIEKWHYSDHPTVEKIKNILSKHN